MAAVTNSVPVKAIPLRNPSLPPLTPIQQENLAKAKQYANQESVRHVIEKQKAQAKQSLENVVSAQSFNISGSDSMILQKQQALVLMCRVYVGSIYYDLKEEVIRNAFSPFGPFKSINMSFDPITGKHKGFAFIEYECPEAAQLALEQMGGVTLGGRSIKVGRPANMPQSHPIIDLLLEESKSRKRLYVASVHNDLSTDDVKSVFSAFGKIISCHLQPDHITGKHKGYGFLEYETLQSANDAVGSMNAFDLGGQFLRVGKAIAPPGMSVPAGSSFSNNPFTSSMIPSFGMSMPPHFPVSANAMPTTNSKFQSVPIATSIPPPSVVIPPVRYAAIPPPGVVAPAPSAIPPPGVVAPVSLATFSQNAASQMPGSQLKTSENTELPNTLSAQEDMKLSGVSARHMVMHKLMRQEAKTCVMVLNNMVGVEEVDDDLEDEVTNECEKYGPTARVVIYTEKQSEEEGADQVVKIFVKFHNSDSCDLAINNLNGRWFGGRKVHAVTFPQEKFDNEDYSE